MAATLRYLDDEAMAISLQPEPLGAVTATKLSTACEIAEDETDKYLGGKGIAIPLDPDTLENDILDEFQRAVAKGVEYVLYSQHTSLSAAAAKAEAQFHGMLDQFIAHADLDHTTVQSHLGVANFQEEHVTDWMDPNSTLENMDE